MAYDDGLAVRIEEILAEEDNISRKKMFGGIAFFLQGNMVCGVSGESLMARVGLDAYEEALAQPGTTEFGPGGRIMKGWVKVAPAHLAEDDGLQAWVQRSLDFARTLPPK